MVNGPSFCQLLRVRLGRLSHLWNWGVIVQYLQYKIWGNFLPTVQTSIVQQRFQTVYFGVKIHQNFINFLSLFEIFSKTNQIPGTPLKCLNFLTLLVVSGMFSQLRWIPRGIFSSSSSPSKIRGSTTVWATTELVMAYIQHLYVHTVNDSKPFSYKILSMILQDHVRTLLRTRCTYHIPTKMGNLNDCSISYNCQENIWANSQSF